jgi:hypothetical protein
LAGLRIGLGLGLGGSAVIVMARLQLLNLVGCQNGGELLSGLLAYSVHLFLRDHRGDGGVVL